MTRFLYWATIFVHYLVFFAFMTYIVVGWTQTDVMTWFCLSCLLIRVAVSRSICPLTSLENRLADKLGIKKSRGFVTDWVLKPIGLK